MKYLSLNMNEVGPSLVTTYAFKNGKEYIVKIKVTSVKGCQRSLELAVTDKYTAESWQSSYDAAYIENLTHKTGNYKHFDVFAAMLQSGLLKTSESITLDLLTFEDLELLRAHRFERNSCTSLGNALNNRRYLILTYTVEFDRRLQAEIERLQSVGSNRSLQKRIEELTVTNQKLIQENQKLTNGGKGLKHLMGSIKSLENSIAKERASFRTQIQKLKAENRALLSKVQQLTVSSRKPGDGSSALKHSAYSPSIRRRSRSRSSSISSRVKASSLSSGSSAESIRTCKSPYRNTKASYTNRKKNSKHDFENLEARIRTLQKMLKEGINLN
ncbi:centrosomal protein CCDC61 isoform X2 [Megachile rotundata]|uniref:centrosomal protein CCDC61 isoform X2 n=1 Tax=Megachile rotundata TaxID=143995 RepID=UPI003FD47315